MISLVQLDCTLRWLYKARYLLLAGVVVVSLCVCVLRLRGSSYRYRHESERAPAMYAPPIHPQQLAWGATVAVGCAATSRQNNFETRIKTSLPVCPEVNGCSLGSLAFFTDLLPSFCRTASEGFDYHFYVAFDFDDPVLWKSTGEELFRDVFKNVSVTTGCWRRIPVELHMVRCRHSRQPARAQNDAMMAAYRANMTYYFRLNDDTLLETKHWTEAFISTLSAMDPPNVGIVAPTTRGEVNHRILTYEFVHRTHVDIFGFYYPGVMQNWFADDWITHVYLPGRAVTLTDVFVLHTRTVGRRYDVSLLQIALSDLDDLIDVGRTVVGQWVDRVHAAETRVLPPQNRNTLNHSNEGRTP